jgi:hypothetical protein
MARDVGVNRVAPRTDEGADENEVRADGHVGKRCTYGEDRQAAWSCTAHEAKKHSLGAIVRMMRRGDESRAFGARRLRECGVARRPRPRLEVAATRDTNARAREWHPEALRKPSCQVQLACGFGAEPVIDAMRTNEEAELGRELREHVEERHRIGATAHGAEDDIIAKDLGFGHERASRDGEECRIGHGVQAKTA